MRATYGMSAYFIAAMALVLAGDTSQVSVRISPEVPRIERRDGQALNFDFIIENTGTDTLELTKVELTVTDRSGAIVLRRFLDNNGFSPSIFTIPERSWHPVTSRLIFNPFHTFPAGYDLAALAYEFSFRRSSDKATVTKIVNVRPSAYSNATDLILPVTGRLLIWDGHDFYSHHRRFDFMHPVARQFGFSHNFMRYAYDFVRVDSSGAMHRADNKANEAYYGFGAPVAAPGSGTVTTVANEQPDNREGEDFFDPMKLRENPMGLYGNHVVIDHGNGEFSLLGHLRQGSITVKVGDRVQQGQTVAQVGSSGSSYFPHLHYELRTGSTMMVEGLPSYFKSFDRIIGNRIAPGTDAVDTGDFIRSHNHGETQ